MKSSERREQRYQRRKQKRHKYGATFNETFTFSHLLASCNKCYKTVGWKSSTQRYRAFMFSNICDLYVKLRAGKYKSKGFYTFTIHERGRNRLIRSVHISERVVQKTLYDYCLAPTLLPSLILDNTATQKGKGVHFTVKRILQFLRRYYRCNSSDGYALVYDLRHYFDNIQHAILLSNLQATIRDEKLFAITKHFIDCFGENSLGLGSQISQICAIWYLNELDHYIKDNLQTKYYCRYMDDGLILSASNSELLQIKSDIETICTSFGIPVNYKKTQIMKLSRGFNFLKRRFVLLPNGKILIIPDKSSAKRMRKKFKSFLHTNLSQKYIRASYASWKSHLLHTNSFFLIRRMDNLFTDKILLQRSL